MKKRNYNDLEPHLSYDSRGKRRAKKVIRWTFGIALIICAGIWLVLRFGLMAKCASAGGFYSADQCTTRCCLSVSPHMRGSEITLD